MPELPAPFADRSSRGLLRSYLETWRLAALEPEKFFRHVRIDQLGPAVVFGLTSLIIGLVFSTLYSQLMQGVLAGWAQRMGGHAANRPHLPWVDWLQANQGKTQAAEIVGHVVLFFVGALVVHLMLLLFRAGSRGFNATMTVMAYSFGPWLLLVVPVPGLTGLVALVWQVVILIVGLAAAQRTSTGKAAAAVLLPVVLGLCCACCGFSSLVMKAGIDAAQSAAGGGTTTL